MLRTSLQRGWLTYQRTITANRWIPSAPHPKQQQFLLHSHTLEVLYGGAAGGGKSSALLMAAAQYVDTPGYAALLFRETFPDLMQPDALIPRSKAWWLGKGPTWSEQQHRWTFPSGATITFGYLGRDDDVYQYQGAAFQFIGGDELTQHTEFRYRYLFSRLRRPADGALSEVPLRMRGGTNPGGKGHEWIKRRFIAPATRAEGAIFIPAKLLDNPSLDPDSYLKSLEYLDPITRAQLLAGDWDAVQGGRFKAEHLQQRYYKRGDYIVLRVPGQSERIFKPAECLRFITCDPASSAKQSADYTVISVWCIGPQGELVWLDCVRVQREVPDIVPLIQQMQLRWKPAFVGIEAVAANNAVLQLAQRAANPGIIAKRLNPLGQDKLVRATAAINLAATGRLWLPGDSPTFPLDDVVGELVRFTGDDKVDANDDVVDTLSYAAAILTSEPSREDRNARPYAVGG